MYMTNALINIASKSIVLPNSKVNSNSILCNIVGEWALNLKRDDYNPDISLFPGICESPLMYS